MFGWAARRIPAAVQADPGPGPGAWDEADLADLLERARSFRRVGGPAVRDPDALLREVTGGLFGAHTDGAGGRAELAPWIPEGWRWLALRRLRYHRSVLDVEVRPRAEWATVRLELTFGPAFALAVELRNVAPVAQVTVDEIALEGPRAIFTVQGQHELVFFFGDAG